MPSSRPRSRSSSRSAEISPCESGESREAADLLFEPHYGGGEYLLYFLPYATRWQTYDARDDAFGTTYEAPSPYDDAPAAWDLPEAMLTGGMPQGFENTRRDVGSLTMKIANKKADIEALLERMAKLQSRYKNMTEGKEEMSETVKKAARKSQREKRRRKKKRDKAKKAKKKMAHPLDGIDEFSTTVKKEEPIPQEEAVSYTHLTLPTKA